MLISGIMAYALITRAPFTVSVIHDRNPIFVKLSDGHIRNAYTVRIANMLMDPANFTLDVDGLHDAHVEIIGGEGVIDGKPSVLVGADQTREVRVLVTAKDDEVEEGEPPHLEFTIHDQANGRTAIARDFFRTPKTIH